MYNKLDNKTKATLLEISDVANILAEAPQKLAVGLQYFLQVNNEAVTVLCGANSLADAAVSPRQDVCEMLFPPVEKRSRSRSRSLSFSLPQSRTTHSAHGARAQGPAPQGGPAPPSN